MRKPTNSEMSIAGIAAAAGLAAGELHGQHRVDEAHQHDKEAMVEGVREVGDFKASLASKIEQLKTLKTPKDWESAWRQNEQLIEEAMKAIDRNLRTGKTEVVQEIIPGLTALLDEYSKNVSNDPQLTVLRGRSLEIFKNVENN